ncbi:DDE superfamily endonuclease-domain-containing protein, partial [Armillaria luteobubalina]
MRRRNPPSNPSQRTTKGTRTITPDTEERLAEAEAALRQGECKTYRQASEQFNVPYFTLRRRCRDEAAPKTKAHLAQLLLPPASEEILVDWIKFLSATGHPVNKRTIRPKLGRGSGLDPKRAKAFNYSTVQSHFALLKEHMETHNIPWENVYNMDEKGIQLGGGRRGSQQKFFFSRADTSKYKLKSDDLQLVTIIEAVCADGSSDIPPGFVFAGSTKFPECVATSENGWTDDFVGFEWFKQGFVPKATDRNESGTPILLIYDGHGSHTTLEWIEYACEHNIHLFCLPPHTTHRLQPLDVGVFGPLQHAWFIRCDKILEETGNTMQLRDVVTKYMKARRAAFKPETILKAWRKAGIRPINPDIFTEADYAPSYSTSTQMHVPPSFPRKLPSVPDASSDDGFFDPRTLAFSDPLDYDYGEENDEESDSQSSSDSDMEETEGED